MSAVVVPFTRPIPVPRVEISSPGTSADGERVYFVDIVDHDGGACMWSGPDVDEACRAAADCADAGAGQRIAIVDLTSTTGVRQ